MTGVWYVVLGIDCFNDECKGWWIYWLITNTVPAFDSINYSKEFDTETAIG